MTLDERERLRRAAQNVTDRRTLMADGFWVSQKEMRALDDALAALAHDRPSEDEERRDAITQDRTWASGYAAGRAALVGSSDPEACAYECPFTEEGHKAHDVDHEFIPSGSKPETPA